MRGRPLWQSGHLVSYGERRTARRVAERVRRAAMESGTRPPLRVVRTDGDAEGSERS